MQGISVANVLKLDAVYYAGVTPDGGLLAVHQQRCRPGG